VASLVGGDGSRAALRDILLAVRAVLPDGGAARFGSKAVKDVAGYDMKRLYIGSGTAFGALRDVTLRVVRDPHA
jgi:glycolate oxidase